MFRRRFGRDETVVLQYVLVSDAEIFKQAFFLVVGVQRYGQHERPPNVVWYLTFVKCIILFAKRKDAESGFRRDFYEMQKRFCRKARQNAKTGSEWSGSV